MQGYKEDQDIYGGSKWAKTNYCEEAMNIEYKKTSELIPYTNNAKKHPEKQISQIAGSIKEFGFNVPILIDRENSIIAGHGRLFAAQKLKLEEVPCICIDHLSETQKKAFIIADNKLNMNTGFDDDILDIELNLINEDIPDFDFEDIGFDIDEISKFFTDETENGLIKDDDVTEPPEEPTAKLGDIWELGNHRLMCGDSTDLESVKLLMSGHKADMVFTDPPYLMDFNGGIHADGSKSFNSKHGAIKNDKMSKKEGDEFLDKINKIIKDFVLGAFYITFYRLGISQYLKSMDRVGLKNRSLIIWNKGNHTLSNSDYMSMYEPIFYGWVSKHKFYGGKNGRDIWDIKRTAKNDLHPTMKPVELCQKAIEDGSGRHQYVLDLFLGSGSTLIACEKTNRKCYGMELDPKYCDVIVERWERFTGKKAKLLTLSV